ncbi:ABC transporter permease [Alkaliphilus hydrothermalis]|uniref:Peptide/nickel transport system permease protein n=1 Tax=Alkaliphilus hydrothermalis TaxID=1482730 RepID=A0ABS2NNW6_9FIRM|nr:ABC transporter permease [Alkaliphilus hydrothermalis]MBM7614620.1 peptide/nickel transport system permease protein [Alkaliphilus hydrothermalis]
MENNRGSKTIFEVITPYATYLGKRLISIIPVLLLISLVIFALISMMPGDPIMAMLDPEKTATMTTEERNAYVETMRAFMGYDKPPVQRYFIWLRDTFLEGEFGYSIRFNKPVNQIIGGYIARSFEVNIIGFFFAFLISIPIGITAAVKKNKLYDKTLTVLTIVGISLPSFFLALLLIMLFVVILKLLPFSGMSDPRGVIPDWKYLVLPVTVVVLTSLPSLTRYVRAAMIEVLKSDYVRTARAKGLTEKVVIYRHAFQNALIPVVTLVGMWIPALFGGSIVVERIFAYPGMGYLLSEAYNYKDRAIIQTALLFFGMLTLLGNVFIDVGYMVVDPRIREGKVK